MANRSRRYTLNWRDMADGFIAAALFGGLTTLYNVIENGGDMFSHATVMMAVKGAIGGGILWLLKNFLTNSKGQVLPKKTLNQKAK